VKRSIPLLLKLFFVLSIVFASLVVGNSVRRQSGRRAQEAELMEDLTTMRVGIANYTKDRLQLPHSLQDLVDEKYLTEIPTDPLTRKKDWVLHFGTVVLDSGQSSFGVDNVHSNSEQNGW
jgi:general secretion pathway protein G